MKDKVQRWLHNLVAAIITGGSNAALAALGMVGADAIGIKVPQLDLKQVGVIFVSGAVIGLLAYLKQSPLPPEE
jgi:hypothetical protein